MEAELELQQTSVLQWTFTEKVTRGVLAFILLIGTYVLISRHLYVLSQPYPLSTDGFYYLQEYRSWSETASSFYDRVSPGTMFVGIIGSLLNLSPFVSFNLTVLISLWISSLSLFFLTRANNLLFASLLFISYWGSDLLFYRHYAFLNQSMAVATAFSAALLIERSRYRSGYLCIAISALLHPFGGAISAPLLLGRSRSTALVQGVLISGLVIITLFGIYQVDRTVFEFSSWKPNWVEACSVVHCSPKEYGEFLLTSVAILIVISLGLRGKSTHYPYLTLFLILQLPIWSHHEQMAERLAFSSVWVACLAIAKVSLPQRVVLILLALTTAVSLLPEKVYPDPYPATSIIKAHATRLREWIPEDAVVIAPHGMQFRVAYLLRRKSRREMRRGDNKVFLYGPISRRGRCFALAGTEGAIPLNTPCVLLTREEGFERLR